LAARCKSFFPTGTEALVGGTRVFEWDLDICLRSDFDFDVWCMLEVGCAGPSVGFAMSKIAALLHQVDSNPFSDIDRETHNAVHELEQAREDNLRLDALIADRKSRSRSPGTARKRSSSPQRERVVAGSTTSEAHTGTSNSDAALLRTIGANQGAASAAKFGSRQAAYSEDSAAGSGTRALSAAALTFVPPRTLGGPLVIGRCFALVRF